MTTPATAITHLDDRGAARMVDITRKPATHRAAVAESWVLLTARALESLLESSVPKGDVFGAARIAGILAAKKTSELVPLCHSLPLSAASVEFEIGLREDEPIPMRPSSADGGFAPNVPHVPLPKLVADAYPNHPGGLRVKATAATTAQTGVEMEALTAAMVASLTVYDMLKALDKGLVISSVRLLSKTGGKSGDWTAPDQ